MVIAFKNNTYQYIFFFVQLIQNLLLTYYCFLRATENNVFRVTRSDYTHIIQNISMNKSNNK